MSYLSILKCLVQISLQGWNPSGETLISGLADLYDSVPRAGQKKHREEAVFVLQFLLLRGVVFLLNTVFNKGDLFLTHMKNVSVCNGQY